MVNNFVRVLENLGLTTIVAEIYVALFELKTGSIQDIARQSGLHRTQIYRHIPLMLEERLITEMIEGKRKHYIPNPPNRILASYEKKRDAQIAMMSHMQSLYDEHHTHSRILYKKGRSGISDFYSDVVDSLPRGGVFYRITTEKDTKYIDDTYIPLDYKKRRDEKGIERMIIMSESNAKKKTKKLEREIHTLPDDKVIFDDDISFTIYGEKIAYIDFTKELSIIIEDATIAEFHKKLFRILYDSLA